MPVPIKKINKGQGLKTLTLPYGDDVLNLVYNRSKYTPKRERELHEEAENKNIIGGLYSGFLGSLVVSWDAMDVHPEDRERAEQLESDPDNPPSMRDYESAGIRMIPVPLNADTFDALLSIEAQADLINSLSRDQKLKANASENTSDS